MLHDKSKQLLPVKSEKKRVANRQSALSRAVARFAAHQNVERNVRIGFLIDATSSRAHTWNHAQAIQRQMFDAMSGLGALTLRLMHFGGDHLTDHGWMDNPQAIATVMRKVECRTGYTKILPALRAYLEDSDLPRAIILVGDMFEEHSDEAAGLVHALRDAGVKVHTFLEGDDEFAMRMFSYIAQVTGGTFACFGTALPLRDLCEGVTLLAAGGQKAAARITNQNVKQLLLSGPSGT